MNIEILKNIITNIKENINDNHSNKYKAGVIETLESLLDYLTINKNLCLTQSNIEIILDHIYKK